MSFQIVISSFKTVSGIPTSTIFSVSQFERPEIQYHEGISAHLGEGGRDCEIAGKQYVGTLSTHHVSEEVTSN